MPITIEDAVEARRNIAGVALRTPLVRLNTDEHEVYLKLENLQPIGRSNSRRRERNREDAAGKAGKGLLTASAGNMAQGVAYCARRLNIPATVVAPDTAPETKLRAVERLGGRIIKAPSTSGGRRSRRGRFREWMRRSSTP